jgi:hypothetical protein
MLLHRLLYRRDVVPAPRLRVVLLEEGQLKQAGPVILPQRKPLNIIKNRLINEFRDFLPQHCVIVNRVPRLKSKSKVYVVE